MKNNILNIFISALVSLAVFTGCDKDKYAEINTDPSTVGEGNVQYLFTQAFLEFEPSGYLYWFYISKITKPFIQVNGGSRTSIYNTMGEVGGIGSQFVAVKKYEEDIKDVISRMSAEDQPKYQQIQAMLNTLTAYLAVLDTDLYGSMPYSEAAQARYGGTLTPKYDTQQELFNTLLDELDHDISVLSSSLESQISLGNQDPMYGGNAAKWLKFANGIKLKIAVRLLHQDKTKALQIAQTVASNEAYLMTTDDSFLYNKGTSPGNSMDDYVYHFGNGVEGMGTANKTIIDFMKKNVDPRMLVMYHKNQFNSEVIQAFFDAQALAAEGGTTAPEIPAYVLENVNYTTDANGKRTFQSWGGPGEPWVRYYGCPLGIDISDNAEYTGENNYFLSDKWQVVLNGKDKTYTPLSSLNERLVRGRVSYTFPTAPDGATVQLNTSGSPWWGMGMTAGEINLYLAELSLAGASLPKTAAEYFEAGIRASAIEYNEYATLNRIPYYSAAYCNDPLDAPVTYGDTEIEAMLANADYQLTGNHADDLEKVYIQQYLHFMYQPVEQFVSARRGGVPKIGSSLLPWNTAFDPTIIPRRLYVTTPTDTDIMRDIKNTAYQQEGFTCTTGDAGEVLNRERVWYDQGAPQFGAGPNL